MNAKTIDVCAVEINHDVPVLAQDGSNGSQFYTGDVLNLRGDEFKNYGGWPRNELAIINEQQSEAIAQAMCDKLVQVHDDGTLEKDMPDSELRLQLKSRYCQTPSEQTAHFERLLEIRDERIAEKQRIANERAEELRIQKKKDDLWNSLTPEEKEQVLKRKREKEVESLIDD